MIRVCRWCQREGVPVDEHGISFCDQCRSWDTTACFSCRITVGFPAAEPQVTYEQALTSPVLQHDAATEVARQAERIVRKSFIYCPRCFHNAYFVVAGTAEDSRECVLCGTVWNRLTSAEHAKGIS